MKYYLLILLSLSSVWSQKIEEGQSLDRIVAVVGEYKILNSEITAQIYRLSEMNPSIDPNDEKVREEMLNSLIDEKLLVVKAKLDSVEVLDAEVDARWNQLLEQWKMRFGSIQRIEALYKKSVTELRYDYEDQIKDQLLALKLQQSKFGLVSITPSEVKKFYEEYKDSLQVIGDRYKVAHIVRNVKANTDRKKKAYNLAMDIRDSLLEGADFETLAKSNSEDPNTANDGGNLGWFDRGRLFPEFENAAFALQSGETSLPIETPFGFHLIQTIEKKENSINTRHILIKIDNDIDNNQVTKDFLMDLKDSLESGADFAELALSYSDDESTKGFGGELGDLTMEEMPASYREVVSELKEGQISEPLLYPLEDGKSAFSILKVMGFIPAHKMNINEDYQFIENYAKNFKQKRLMNEWVQELRKDIYWEIKEYDD